MATLFLIKTQDVGDQVLGSFDRVLKLESISDLIVRLYRDRLSNINSYEKSLSMVVYGNVPARGTREITLDTLELEELRELLQQQFPCFNLTVTSPADAADRAAEILSRQLGHDSRLSRMLNWMYSENTNQCSLKVYTMLEHLSEVRHPLQKPYSSLIAKEIDLRSLLELPGHNSEQHYWNQLSTWDFSALSLTTSELIWVSFLILDRLSTEAHIRISSSDLFLLLLNLEASYHQGNKFHNFRHAVDVMQATWQLCCCLSSYIKSSQDVLLLCIAAIGHDIGHPGTNNALLCEHHSPIAEIYGGCSVLENFHGEVFISLLQIHWPLVVSSQKLAISDAILATDMALHSQYLDKLESAPVTCSTLMSLIIKAADISNVTRPLEISTQWAVLITCEFDECTLLEKRLKEGDKFTGTSESDVNIPSTLNSILEKYPSIPKGQLFFINTFAQNLFAGPSDKFEELKFLNENVQSNKKFWLGKC